MTTEEKAFQLLTDAWNYFWRHCPDTSAYYGWYLPADELDSVTRKADEILARAE